MNMKRVINDKKTTLTHDFTPEHEYEVIVRAIGPDGTEQAMELSARNTITIKGRQSTPTAAADLVVVAGLSRLSLSWTNPADYDFYAMEVWRSATNIISTATKVAEAWGDHWTDEIGSTNTTRYYWIRSLNTSGYTSISFHPYTLTGIGGTTTGIIVTEIDDFSVTATKMFTKAIILTGDAWANNSPGGGSIAWNAHNIVYNGASYPIKAGNTALGYIYWIIGTAVYSTSTAHPVLGTTRFMIAINTAGIHTLVWNSSANMVIGTAFISNLAVTNAKIALLAVDTAQIALLAVKDAQIANLDVDKLTANAASTNEFVSNTAQIKNAIITNAKINDLNAIKINAGDIAVARITAQAGNAVNAGVVSISAARVNIAGTTTFTAGWAAAANAEGDIDILNTTNAPAEANADVTGSNTAADTVLVQGSTIIIGGHIATALLTATNIQTGILTGRTVQTAASGLRIVLDSFNHRFVIIAASEATAVTIQSDQITLVSGYIDAGGGFKDGGVAGIDDAGAGIASAITVSGGIVTAITKVSHIGVGGAAHAVVIAAGADGFMTGADKTKLNSISGGSRPGTVIDVTGTAPVVSSGGTSPAISIPAATAGSAGHATAAQITKLDGIEALADVTDQVNVKAAFDDSAHGTRSGGTLHGNATVVTAGFMSAADKIKLNGL